MVWFSCCELCSVSSLATNRPALISKVLLHQQRQNLPKPQVQLSKQMNADRREGQNNSRCRTYSATTLKALLNNTLKSAEMCQTFLVGENERNQSWWGRISNSYRELCSRQANEPSRPFILLTAVCSTALKLQTNFSVFPAFTAYSHVKTPYQPLKLSK